MKKISTLFFLLATVCIFSCKKPDYNAEPQTLISKKIESENKKDRILVTFKEHKDNDLIKSIGGNIVDSVFNKAMEKLKGKEFYIIEVDNADNAIKGLKGNAKIKSVSKDHEIKIPDIEKQPLKIIIKHSSNGIISFEPPGINKPYLVLPKIEINGSGLKSILTKPTKTSITETYPNDSLYVSGDLWGMKNAKFDVAWQTNKGSQKIVTAIIDQVYGYWGDNCGKLFVNPDEIPDNGIDDDGNGYIDDTNGYNFFNNSNKIFIPTGGSHATHVGGTIGANGNNFIGVIGGSPECTILPLPFIDGSGSGATSNAIKAIDYLVDLVIRFKTKHPDIRFINANNSWGYTGPETPELTAAIDRLRQVGVLFNCAAGNEHSDNDADPNNTFYPAGTKLDNVTSVGALNSSNGVAYFSNWGATKVHVFAPGEGIWSTIYSAGDIAYASFSGTSMATPHVSAAQNLYAAGHPNATYIEIKNAILNNARKIPSLVGKCTTEGTLDVSTFTQSSSDVPVQRGCTPPIILPIPNKITGVTQTASTDNSFTLKWNKSTSTGHSFYGVQVFLPNGYQALLSTYDTTITVTGPYIVSGMNYPVANYDLNTDGTLSPPSDPFTATTSGQPDLTPCEIPTGFRVASRTATTAIFTWNNSSCFKLSHWWLHGHDSLYYTNFNQSYRIDGRIPWNWGNALEVSIPSDRSMWFWLQTVTWWGVYSEKSDSIFIKAGDSTVTPPPPPPPPPPPVDTTISITGLNKTITITKTPPGIVEIQRAQKRGGLYSTIASTINNTYLIITKPKKWYRAKYGTKISNEIQL